ncbi:MAG: NAD(P)H-hydrate dehydratase [Alphaproteobacteria bacterium]|nr:NAD(P)H-hydrate dehydratase [Alphaproteobacteria bacterium]
MEILTNSEMQAADQLTISAGTPGFTLMLAAGQLVAEAAQQLVPVGPILVIAGPGNNGGDGLVAAANLSAQGREVAVILMCERDALRGDAALAARGWKHPLLPFNPQAVGRPALIIDALFGAGLARVLEGEARDMIEAINVNGAPVLAVDLPSGISGTSAAVMGVAVRATATITFFRKKPGHLLMPGRSHCGRVHVGDIGIPASVLDQIRPQAFENSPTTWGAAFPVPRVDGHKYDRGHVVAVSGNVAATGAARLAARAALRAGAGLVTLASPGDALLVNASHLTAVMLRRIDNAAQFTELLSDRRYNACVIGPGVGTGEQTRQLVHAALGAARHVVLDADALTGFSDVPATLFEAITASGQAGVVLTPHEGEFARLFPDLAVGACAKSKLERVRLAAARSGAVVVLKGADSTVAAPDGRATIAANAPPWLASAGAGDVLAGIIAGLLAQGVSAFEAASIGVWMHGEAAAAAGPGLIAEDLSENLPAVHRRIHDGLNIA